MKSYSFSSNNSLLTVETGLQWGQVYKLVDNVNKLIVGGQDPSVGVGGYSLGGGHSVLTPFYGLSADFVKEYYKISFK